MKLFEHLLILAHEILFHVSALFLCFRLTLPPFPPFPGAAYGASLLGNIMYRGGNLAQIPHNRAAGNGMQRISGGGGMARGFDNCK